jgi:hypothetical protein
MNRPGRRLVVLFHARDEDRNLASYTVYHLAPFWREAGHDVRFLFGTRARPPADLCFVHVDLSVVPDDYLEFAAGYPASVNARVKDIRKSTFSQNLVAPGDPWPGPVIVKSDLNSAGRPERLIRESGRILRREFVQRTLRSWERLTGLRPPFMTTRDYQIYDRLADVPRRLFRDRRIVVEKFLPEMDNGHYHTRIYQFLGDRSVSSRLVSTHPIVNVSSTIRVEEIAVHPDILAWRERLGLDYGKLDYVEVDGRAVLLDVNKTTGTVRAERSEDLQITRRHRAAGIESFFV